jgi:hypothetical protein
MLREKARRLSTSFASAASPPAVCAARRVRLTRSCFFSLPLSLAPDASLGRARGARGGEGVSVGGEMLRERETTRERD